MTKTVISLVGFLFYIVCTSGQQPTYNYEDDFANITNDSFQPSENTTEKFDWTLFKKLSELSDKNILVSPLSLKIALAIIYQASAGQTQDELQWVLDFENKTTNLNKYQRILEQLETPSSLYQLNIGSRMYVDKTFPIQQKFRQLLKTSFHTDLVEFDVSYPELTTIDANRWVENFTQGHIKNLVDKDDIENAVVLLLNTIYYRGSWAKQFLANETVTDKFFTNSTSHVNVPMMKQTDRFYYTQSKKLDAQILRMPYTGGNLSMYIILPKTNNGLSALIKDITHARLSREMYLLEMTDVKLTIPKFSYDITNHLVPILKEMGIRDLFDNSASIPGISRGRSLPKKLLVSNILQKSGIEFSETGTIAYAATEITLVNKFGDNEEVEFLANRPFLFYLEDENTKQILFMGKVENPSKLTPVNEEDAKGNNAEKKNKNESETLAPRPQPRQTRYRQ